MSVPDRLADAVTGHSRIVIVVLLVFTALVGAGMPMVDDDSSLDQFESESEEAKALERIQGNSEGGIEPYFATEGDENTTSVQVIVRGDNVLTKESLIASLEFQQELRDDESINSTLVENQSIFGIENLVANAAIMNQQMADGQAQGANSQQPQDGQQAQDGQQTQQTQDGQQTQAGQQAPGAGGGDQPTLEEQIAALEDLDDEEYEQVLEQTLSETDGGQNPALALMPSSYDPGSTEAETRMTAVTQSTTSDATGGMGGGAVSEQIVESQLEIRDLANAQDEDYIVFGGGIITDEIDRSMGDSLAIVGPLALVFVVIALLVAYRDLLDIVLGVVGIAAVLIWTFGFMGWAGIAFNQMFVAVPVLLIGLSIDYAIHVFMRHREQREEDGKTSTVRGSMSIALAGVGAALVWVTATTVIGFLSNLVSPIGPIREFGIVSSVGIVAALIVFGALIPALKVEIDEFLEGRGLDRRKRAFGTGGGRFSQILTVGSTAARKAPMVVLVLVLLLSAGGAYGATQVDTSFQEEDFLAESPPAWTEKLPGGMSPGEYHAKDDLEFVNQHFQRQDSQAQILVESDGGGVDDPDLLAEINETRNDAAASDVAYEMANGDADVQDPLSTMESVAAQNESFNESFRAVDTDGDGVPDENVTALYDQLFELDGEAASQVLHRTDGGEYDAARMVVGIQGGATASETTEEMRTLAENIEDGGDGRWSAIATGSPIVNHIVEQDLLNTVLESLLITLVAVFVFLSGAYYLTGDTATLGAVTLLPVAFTVSWILGTMYLIGMPFNVLTGMITSLTIGLGVAYSIHVSDRYTLELERQGNVWSALQTTVTGTGGALLGSAATTVGGFGTLAFAILPALRQFGIITGLTITYAFLASVIVLPSLLVLWTRYFGPDVSFDVPSARAGAATASDGGTETDDASRGGGDE
ncbi:efflux RND transporter permease subunit [Haloterrigena alkaliphila]|uniref:MMPL family transporter n=1 Tax=Haloterrigena alkaliphila TaxID=2816475 RepID=A0A8A2VFW3_9EURY|nr:MMPL family transporter [Haloterrigena alkaliphila]QSW99590.1 MMPL family transporter [Haloterrigena alkaliphila]